MTLDDFSQALFAALNRHFPQAPVTFATTRDITLMCRAEIAADKFLFVYFSALTGKTSYACFSLVLQDVSSFPDNDAQIMMLRGDRQIPDACTQPGIWRSP